MKFIKSTLLITAAVLMLSHVVTAEVSGKSQSLSKSNHNNIIPDISSFLQITKNTPMGYSWDGSKVFFRSKMSGTYQIYRLTDKGWPYQLTTFDDGIDFFSLSNNSDKAIVGASAGGSEQSQLYLMDTESGSIDQLSNFEDVKMGSVIWAKDDKSIFYRSNEENKKDFFIYRMDINSKISKKIFNHPGYNYVGKISPDGNLIIIYNITSNSNNDIFLYDLTSGKYEQLNQDDIDVRYLSAVIMPDNKTIRLRSNNNKEGIKRIATMTVGSPDINFIDDNWIDPKWEVDGLYFSRDYKLMGAQYNENGYDKIKIREVKSGKLLPSPPLDGMLSIEGSDKDGSFLIGFNGPTRAHNLWRWNPYTEELTQLTFSSYAGIDQNILRQPKLIHYKSFDGLEIPAFLYLPPNYKENEPIPFIVYAHGGPESQFQPSFIGSFQYLLLNGFGILAPNPRGSSGYGLKYLNMDNYKNRKKSLYDYKAGVEWLLENNYSKDGMLGIRGGSYGGYVVLGMITEYPDLFSAAVDVVGISNFKTFLENTKAYRRALREAEYGPLSDPEFLASISPIHKAHLIKTPLLVIHGVNDPRVPIGEARQIIKAVLDNGGIVDSLIFQDEGHGSGKLDNTIKSYRMQAEFYKKYLMK